MNEREAIEKELFEGDEDTGEVMTGTGIRWKFCGGRR